jgi:hypothetical protein
MRSRTGAVLAGLLLTMVGAAAVAQDAALPPVDPRAAAALEAAGLSYRIDAGDFRLDYDVDDQRSQRVWISSGTARIDELEFRDVWSVAARGKGEVPAELARKLLAENVRMILGAWQVNQSADEYLVVFSTPLSAVADAAMLQTVIEVVMFSADRIEKQLSDKDEF